MSDDSSPKRTPDSLSGGDVDVRESKPKERLTGLVLASAVAGGFAGLVGSLFRLLLLRLDTGRGALLAWAHSVPAWGWLVPVVTVAAAAGLARFLVRVLAPDAAGSGIPQIEAALRESGPPDSPLLVPVKFVGGVAAIGAGLALGREGPTVQMGAGVARWVGRLARMGPTDIRSLVAGGSGAGLAAAFGAPLSGAVFVLEELTQKFELRTVVATLSACSAGIAVTYQFLGTRPDFAVPPVAAPGLFHWLFYLSFGVPIGLLGVGYNRLIVRGLDVTARLSGPSSDLAAAFIGGAIGLVAWFVPDILGNGEVLVQSLLSHGAALPAVLGLLALRFAVGPFAYAAQTPGGLFAPLLVVGASIGCACGTALHALLPSVLPDATALTIVGMAGFFAATVRAPVTGMALALELTAVSTLFVPMLATCSVAAAVPTLLGDAPIYDALRNRARRQALESTAVTPKAD
jgi:chloride channel protein, CIC family